MGKSAILLLIICTVTVSSTMLRRDRNDVHGNVIELDAKSVKSPGGLSNVAPEATKIRTPLYANPKLAINLRVTTDSLVSRSMPLGTTAVPKLHERIDHGTKYSDVSPHVEQRKIHAQSTVWAKTHNFENVHMDINSGKAIPIDDVHTQKPMLHGTEPKRF